MTDHSIVEKPETLDDKLRQLYKLANEYVYEDFAEDAKALIASERINEVCKAYTEVVGDKEVSLRSKFVKRFTRYLKDRVASLKDNQGEAKGE